MKKRLHYILLACIVSLSFLKADAINNAEVLKKEQQITSNSLRIQPDAEHVNLYNVHAFYHPTIAKKLSSSNISIDESIIILNALVNQELLLSRCYSKRYLLHNYPSHNFW